MRHVMLIVLIALGMALQGCGAANPVTLARLALLSPLEADPDDMAVRLTLPQGLALVPGSARLVLTGQNGAGETARGAFVLDLNAGLYAIATDDRPRLRALQAQLRDWKASDPDGTRGSLSLTLTPCAIGAGPAPDARVDVAIRLEADGPLLPLIRQGPISAVAKDAEIAALPACDT